jgi:MoaA/NifB/PqqE/SkfB family radical SAM enzyme
MHDDPLVLSPYVWRDKGGAIRVHQDILQAHGITVSFLKHWKRAATIRHVSQATQLSIKEVTKKAELLVEHKILIPVADISFSIPSVEIELTSVCNANCVMCPRDTLSRYRGARHMEAKTFYELCSKLQNKNIPTFEVCGIGEPILHPNCLEFVRHLKKKNPNTEIIFFSNGTAISPRYAHLVATAPIDCLAVSIHSSDAELRRKICNSSMADNILQNLGEFLLLVKKESNRMKIRLGQVLCPESPVPDQGLMEWAGRHGVGYNSWEAWSRAGHVHGEQPKENQPLCRRRAFKNISPHRCHEYERTTFVTYEGDVLACCCDFANETTEGNLLSDSFEYIVGKRNGKMASRQPLSRICWRCDACGTNKPFMDSTYFELAYDFWRNDQSNSVEDD